MTGRTKRLNRISRRSLIGSGAAASALAVAGFPASAIAQRGGTLRVAAPQDIFDRLVAPGAVFDGLTEIDEGGALRGALADNWETTDAGRNWTIALRPDAVFHDGRPVLAEDVTAALAAETEANGVLADVRRLRPVARNVLISLEATDPQLPLRLSDPALVVRPATRPSDTIGSGLYQVVAAEPGRLKLSRVDGHGRRARGGFFDRVELLSMSAAEDRLFALETGRVDLAFDLPRWGPRALLRERRLVADSLHVDGRSAPVIVGHSTRLHGLDGRDPLRIAERGHFA